ncbi:hypothetical protein [Croceicoccus naphthovorans]|nr:hypothetical protein [Croceicoccus naphthovorans]MBB3989258.1 hypothetical protein [Croceicoccus naphthovorans]
MAKRSDNQKTWTRPELNRLGKLDDVASGVTAGPDGGSGSHSVS